MDQLTIADLYLICCERMADGEGDKYVLISDDNEGNGYHGLYYGFTDMNKDFQELASDYTYCELEESVVLG